MEKFIYAEPTLVRETSRRGIIRYIAGIIWATLVALTFRSKDDPFGDVVLSKDLDRRIRRMAKATSNAKRNRAPLRHALFYGPAGTGGCSLEMGLCFRLQVGVVR